jgi:hypothetical protein
LQEIEIHTLITLAEIEIHTLVTLAGIEIHSSYACRKIKLNFNPLRFPDNDAKMWGENIDVLIVL